MDPSQRTPEFLSELEAFAKSATTQALATDHSIAAALKLTRTLFDKADSLFEQSSAKSGCCPTKELLVSEVELAAAKDHIRQTSSAKQQALLEQLLGPLDESQCPFSVDGECLIF